MRKNVFVALVLTALMFCSAASASVIISADTFPDDNFRVYVTRNLDSDNDGILSDAEISAVITIPEGLSYTYDFSSQTLNFPPVALDLANVRDFTGIEYFSELKALSCGGLNLSTLLNLVSNDKLVFLHCERMIVQSLDLSGKTALLYVDCPSIGLETLDVSACENLLYLNCRNNSISSLNLSASTRLDNLNCSNNNLPRLDLSDIDELGNS